MSKPGRRPPPRPSSVPDPSALCPPASPPPPPPRPFPYPARAHPAAAPSLGGLLASPGVPELGSLSRSDARCGRAVANCSLVGCGASSGRTRRPRPLPPAHATPFGNRRAADEPGPRPPCPDDSRPGRMTTHPPSRPLPARRRRGVSTRRAERAAGSSRRVFPRAHVRLCGLGILRVFAITVRSASGLSRWAGCALGRARVV